jgi:hypothetical protein
MTNSSQHLELQLQYPILRTQLYLFDPCSLGTADKNALDGHAHLYIPAMIFVKPVSRDDSESRRFNLIRQFMLD